MFNLSGTILEAVALHVSKGLQHIIYKSSDRYARAIHAWTAQIYYIMCTCVRACELDAPYVRVHLRV